MMATMNRVEAIRLLVERDLQKLDPDSRSRILLDYWSVQEDDPGYETLPAELQQHLRTHDRPHRPEDRLYDPLLRMARTRAFIGTMNSYLEEEITALTGTKVLITGETEKLFACPCCRYRTLELRAEYFICHVCFWEDDGASDPEDRSSPNRMTLGDAQRNFELFGACDRRSLEFVDKDGPRKYPRAAVGEST